MQIYLFIYLLGVFVGNTSFEYLALSDQPTALTSINILYYFNLIFCTQVVVEKFGLIARFGFMHLAATNLALWIRLVIWESGMEWIYFIYLAISGSFVNSVPTPLQLKGFPKSLTFFKHVRSTRSLTLGN